eukprot:COSAG05_NODE_2400_length_3111_cov_5.177291_1_plen_700_part_00
MCSIYFTNVITFTIVVAGVIVGAQTYKSVENDPHLRSMAEAIDKLILCIFTAEAALKMMIYDLRPWHYFAVGWAPRNWSGWNCFDFAIVVASWSMDSNAATMLRLLRLLRVLKLVKSVNQLQMILTGLVKGMKSIGYILVLLLLVFYLFGILAMVMFRENDPFHFGTLPTTLLTLFRMATLEDWTDVMYINMFGCNSYGYGSLIDSRNATADLGGSPSGTGAQEPCDLSKVDATLWVSAIFFVFFVIVSALVVMSLFIGVVTTTMMDASAEIQRKEKQEKINLRKYRKKLQKIRTADTIGTMMQGDDVFENGLPVDVEEPPCECCPACCGDSGAYGMLAARCKSIVQSDRFQLSIIIVIVLAGLLVGVQTYPGAVRLTGGSCDEAAKDCDGGWLAACDWVILGIFTLEVTLKLISEQLRPWRFFIVGWNVFDFLIVFACYMPFAGKMVAVLRLLRLLRVLKLVKSLPQLQMIVSGLMQGLSSIGYISLLLFLVFYLYGVLGIILFRDNDPWHFSSLDIAMLTLFRCSTLEDWTDVMYINMYGCENYGYDLWDTMKVELCTDSAAHGITAAAYFVSFTIISALVMLSLFVGVVTTSMSDASEKMKDKEEMLKKVKLLRNQPNGPSDADLRAWQEHFHAFDRDGSGTIDTDEMFVVLQTLDAKTEKDSSGRRILAKDVRDKVQEMINRADTSGDGDVDFHE